VRPAPAIFGPAGDALDELDRLIEVAELGLADMTRPPGDTRESGGTSS
jgi:hypothetical protein